MPRRRRSGLPLMYDIRCPLMARDKEAETLQSLRDQRYEVGDTGQPTHQANVVITVAFFHTSVTCEKSHINFAKSYLGAFSGR